MATHPVKIVKCQCFGMQMQPRGGGKGGLVGVKRIAQNRMPHGQHVHPQLVAAAGLGKQSNPCAPFAAPDHLPARDRRFAGFMANLVQGPVWPIDDNRQINLAFLASNVAQTSAI